MAKRFIKSPKLYLTDSGLYCHLLDIRDTHTLKTSAHKGGVVETFVFGELIKHIAYSQTRPRLYHYRTSDKKEIDFILEKGDQLIAIEVKSAQTIKTDAFKHIIDLQNQSNKQVIGIVLYAGENLLSFGEEGHGRYAVPLGVFF
jgi:predicted AAA+ superfamily ATPase